MSCAAIARKLTRTTQLWIVQRQYLSRAVSRSFASSSFHIPCPLFFLFQWLLHQNHLRRI
ncbi:BnaA02g19380D [Brassica napus]|uniref:BnaA02g19380D protein n=1 Tax=Brassica napus TaxID=3708 RepID=A0A078IJY2_BRANA|nr:BnaA02g19380D [Brassica napus]